MASSIVLSDNGVTSGSAGIKSTGGNDGVLLLQTTTASGTATTAVLIDNAQNVGVGVTPSAWVSPALPAIDIGTMGAIAGQTSASNLHFVANGYLGSGPAWKYKTTNYSSRFTAGNDSGTGGFSWYTAPSGTAGNAITFTQAMTLDASGNLLVGTTTGPYNVSKGGSLTAGGGLGLADNGGNDVAYICKNGSTSGTYIKFYYNASSSGSAAGGSSPGSITTNGTGVTYGTASDYRLKENVAPMTGALATVAQLKPVTYNWKIDGSDGQGFIAHELQAVVPDCVTGEKDAVDADGNPSYQGIDTSFLVATLTAAIQEQQVLIQSLTDRLTALEGAAK